MLSAGTILALFPQLPMREKSNLTFSHYLTSSDSFASAPSLIDKLQLSQNDILLHDTLADILQVITRDYPPLSKVLAIKLLKELFLTSKENIITQIESKLLDEVAAVAMYKDGQRGASLFVNTNFFKQADDKQKQCFRAMGVDYVMFCKDSVVTWAKLVAFDNDGRPSRFSQKYEDLKKKGVEFPKDRLLYLQSEKEGFERAFRVQFFNSESSFSESLLNMSNCDMLVERELSQCQQLEDNLKETLQEKELDTDWRKVKTIMERVSIFFHQSSIKILNELKELNSNPNASQEVLEVQSRFGQILEDYEYLRSKKIKYEEFLDSYGYKHFTPEKLSQAASNHFSYNIVPEVNMRKDKRAPVQVSPPNGVLQGSKSSGLAPPKHSDSHEKLYEANLAQIRGEYERKMEEEKQKSEFRIAELKKQVKSVNPREDVSPKVDRVDSQNRQLRIKVQELLEDLNKSETEKARLKMETKVLQAEMGELQRHFGEKDGALKRVYEEAEKYKSLVGDYEQRVVELRSQINSSLKHKESRREEEEALSVQSTIKLERKLQNLTQQRNMLKEQLSTERGKKYENVAYEIQLLKEEVSRLKGKLKEKEEMEMSAILKLDIMEVENIKLKEEVKVKETITDSLKKQNEWINRAINQINSSQDHLKRSEEGALAAKSLPPAKNRLSVKDFVEMGMEGSTYFDVLTREFKVKYKRSCFKRKQLLYKQYNLEVGCITQVSSSNRLIVTVFMTNNGSLDLHNLRFKILNPTNNQIEADVKHIETISKGEQQKIYIDALLHSYPIGPVVLKMEYYDTNTENMVQLLLPVSIIKLVRASSRRSDFRGSPRSIQFKFDHKMIQNLSVLKEYFPQVQSQSKEQEGVLLRMVMTHEHSNSEWEMDLEVNGDEVVVRWGSVAGYQEIQDYYIRTLKNLLSR